MKMKTRIISLSILAILTACMLNVAVASAATPAAAPKPVGDTLWVQYSSSAVCSGGTVYFSGTLTNGYGYGLGGYSGYLTGNGYYISNTNFYTNADGSWSVWLTFNTPGAYNIVVNCDGMSSGVWIQVY